MHQLHKKFCLEGFDSKGVLTSFSVNCPYNFNFAYDVVDQIAKEEPERRAMIWTNVEGEERFFTFGDMMRYSNQVANLFRNYGIGKGDMVMLVLKRHYQFWFSILALHKLGAVAIPATHLLTTKDFAYRFDSATVKAVVCTSDGDVAKYVDEAEMQYGPLAAKFMACGSRPGWVDFDKEMAEMSDSLERVETVYTDPMLLYFTSGTTGYPKMVLHDFSYPLAHIITAKHWHNVDSDGIHLAVSDTGWGKAVWGKLYGQWLMGTCVFVYDYDKFVPADLLGIIEKYKVTSFCAPPTIYRFFIKEGIENYDLSHLKYACIAGEALNPEVFYKFKEYTGLSLMEGFGQTETTLLICNLVGTTPKPGSMGRPSPLYDVDLVDEDGRTVPPGEVGEIVVHTKEGQRQIGLFDGYYRAEELTRQAWHDGLYHTGDTAWRDEDGYFWYVGRTDDVIKASGYRIGPFEIESVLITHPAVLECAVTGAPDPIRGTVVKATVVLAKGYAPSEELKKELQTHVKKGTAPYKYPRIVEFVEELPKTISGKIRRVQLREQDEEKGNF